MSMSVSEFYRRRRRLKRAAERARRQRIRDWVVIPTIFILLNVALAAWAWPRIQERLEKKYGSDAKTKTNSSSVLR